MDKEQALRIWDRLFPGREVAYDYASHPLRREDCQNRESAEGWDVDFVKPLSQGGTTAMENLLPAAFSTILLRGGRTSFSIGEKIYEVRRGRAYKTFALFDVTDRQHPIDLTPDEENQDPEYNRRRMDESLGKTVSDPRRKDFNAPLRNSLLDRVIQKEGAEDQGDLPSEGKAEQSRPIDEEGTNGVPAPIPETVEGSPEESRPALEERESPMEEEALPTEEGPALEEDRTEKEDGQKDDERERIIVELREEIERLRQEREQREEEYKALEERLRSLQETRAELESQLRQQEDEKERSRQELEGQILRLQHSKEELETVVQQRDEEEKELKERLDSFELERNQYRQKEESRLQEEVNRQAEIQRIQEKERQLSESLQHLKGEKEELQTKLEERIRAQVLFEERTRQEQEKREEEFRSLRSENQQIALENEQLREESAKLAQEKEQGERRESDGQAALEKEREERRLEREGYQASLARKEEESRSLQQEKERLQARLEEAEQNRLSAVEEWKAQKEQEERLLKEKEEQDAEITGLNEKSLQNEALLVQKDAQLQRQQEEIEGLRQEAERNRREKEALEEKRAESEREGKRLQEVLLLVTLGGKEEAYSAIKEELGGRGFAYDRENIETILSLHPEYLKEDEGRILFVPKASESQVQEIPAPRIASLGVEEVQERLERSKDKEEALSLFHELGKGKDVITDFAGRKIARDCYGEDAPEGWNVFKVDDKDGIVANVATIKEIKKDVPFLSNQHLFELAQQDGRWAVTSKEAIVNPYDLLNAIEISQENSARRSPLIYLYVKAVGTTASFADRKELAVFFDLLDRTSRRCCPLSYLQMEVESQKFDQAFLTFDGTVPGAYKEVFDYAILINSYRDAFRKRGKLDAILVLDEVAVTPGQRHDCYERLCVSTKDPDLNVTRLNLCFSGAVSTPIRRTLHIGPNVLGKVPIATEQLRPSRLGQEFSKENADKGSYMECNFIYTLDGAAQEKEKGENE